MILLMFQLLFTVPVISNTSHHFCCFSFKSNVCETWRVILVSGADIFLSESLRIPAERLSQSEIGLRLR